MKSKIAARIMNSDFAWYHMPSLIEIIRKNAERLEIIYDGEWNIWVPEKEDSEKWARKASISVRK